MKNLPTPAFQSVLNLAPYVGGASSIKGKAKVVKLSSNENAFGTSPAIIKAIQEHAAEAFLYPDGGCTELRKAIANVHKLDADRIFCGSGSDEIISLLCQAYLTPNDEVIITQYAFLMYKICAVSCGASTVCVPEKNYKIDPEAIIKAVNKRTKMIFITNPGNPTGTYLTKTELKNLLNRLPSDILVVIDSAYAEFVPEKDYTAGEDLVDEFENVVMLRTFSKIYSMGGMRLGWMYAPAYVLDLLHRFRSPFSVNRLAQYAGIAAINDRATAKKCFEHNAKWLKQLPQRFADMGLKMTPSSTNFVLVHFPETHHKAADADLYLQDKGFIVRRVTGYGLPNALRITIGTDEQMEELLSHLADFMHQLV